MHKKNTSLKKIALPLLSLAMLAGCGTAEKKNEAELWLTMPDKSVAFEKQESFLVKETENQTVITIDTSKTYQEMDGFGYTLTGGSAKHITNMSAPAREKLLQELYGTGEGDIGVSYIRISIGASDLDEKLFSYNDLPEGETDENMEKFDLGYDKQYLIPVLQQILKINPDIKILGSPWSPPVWMKDNGDTRGGSLKPEFYPAYAKYFVKYIQEMKANGITIDAVTVQNEPLHPGNNPSLLMPAEAQKEFVRDHLGPEFEKNNIKTKIIVYDHNADRPDYPITILDDPEAAKYVDGSAFHLYGGTIDAVSKVHDAHPNKNLYFTEQWVGAPGDFAKELTWHTENLIIGAPRNWCKTVLEWNLAADENQLPHTDRGGCDRCLGAVTITGDEVTREPAYYIIAHASKFVRPGSVRVDSNMADGLPNVAYQTPNGNVVAIVQNTSKEDKTVKVNAGEKNAVVTLKAGAIATLVLQ
ncbi:glycoside hydrolase family 30 beta sandwich domain-containing protein [Flavobacterium rakeshii]|uniref:glycoside hydrolase family 30 protein n=1 Tax=Flavobacterium rakeshii TaxID=1038845 RepID=UPI002E7BBCE1|nr:glycoside hydrolase family 30 beta sandwich domain-containing protein [Flavobacterium rakeshii]MEE1899125.1 glycoside hydrolase family 30 beta sandwich domain-containing protein [Flavobacterium rakeshii]